MGYNYFVLDVETCPIELDGYFELSEEDKFKKLNSMDSRIVAVGIKNGEDTYIYKNMDEKEMLERFWHTFEELYNSSQNVYPTGFNIKGFDMPFLVNRSFINDVKIYPIKTCNVVELREKLNFLKYGALRGKLKEYAKLMGLETLGDGSQVAELVRDGAWDKLEKYLVNDLVITDAIAKRCIKLDIFELEKYYPLKQ